MEATLSDKNDGLDLARCIQAKKWPALPVLLATGYSDAANRATEEGFMLLTKPYQPAEYPRS
jgi:CheY-like chemotaxis protein